MNGIDIGSFPFAPSNTKDSVLEPILDAVPPPNFPQLRIKADCDSIYLKNGSFKTLISSLGPKTFFRLPSLLSIQNFTTGSRWSVNFDSLNDPPMHKNKPLVSAPLNWFQNTRIAVCRLSHIQVDLHINVFFLGNKKLCTDGRGRFSKIQLGTIISALNIARFLCIQDLEEKLQDDETPSDLQDEVDLNAFVSMHPFEGSTVSKDSSAKAKNFDNYLTASQMGVFAAKFDEALGRLADNEDPVDLTSVHTHGIRGTHKAPMGVDTAAVRNFASDLQDAILFTATCAGCKDRFNDMIYTETITWTEEEFTSLWKPIQAKITAFLEEHYRKLLEKHNCGTMHQVYNHLLQKHGVRTKRQLLEVVTDLEEPLYDEEHQPPYCVYGPVTEFEEYVNEKLNKLAQELQNRVYSCVRESFGQDNPDSPSYAHIYLDFAITIFGSGAMKQTHLLPVHKQSKQVLIQALMKR